MASVETNDRKRMEMSDLVIRLRGLGWTVSQIAALMYVTPGTVGAWKMAKSMGTNDQRARLRELKSPGAERTNIAETVRQLSREVTTSQNQLEEDMASNAEYVAKSRQARINRIKARIELLCNLFNLTT